MKTDGDQRSFNLQLTHFVRIFIYLCCLGSLIFGVFLLLAVFRISSSAFWCHDNVNEVPYHKVGLLLGTSPQQAPGIPNAYFTSRIEAAAELYRHKKIDFILASGDNRAMSYNEPREMRRALVKAGVPKERIILDFAGIRTLDSVLRAKSVFMLQDFTVISQGFHNERAIFIAQNAGIKADGFNAIEPGTDFSYLKVRAREFFARIKCVLDIYFLETGPHFYGPHINIGDNALPVEPSNKPRRPTSKPKLISDNAKTLKELALAEEQHQRELEALARAQEEAARLKEQQNQNIFNSQEDLPPDDTGMAQSESLSEDAQEQAQREAESTAADSLRDIDRVQKTSPKKEHRTFGDPWD